MKIKDARESYYYYSGKTSDISRQLSFVGLGIIWIFRISEESKIAIPDELIFPMIAFVLSLTCDLLQYITATLIWGSFHRHHEAKFELLKEERISEKEVNASKYLNWPALFFFSIKVTVLLVGYFALLKYFVHILRL
ncbi:MAG: hypothetical protein HUJ22_09045 [Gracilimonas sp.]|uniref:hypothetical protein n=1 Tax=Gracilimonas sp. TaxID=1974203 RepID=UPI0019C34494|nr:hypothetical protein [Gracilimonas sp.]MBD3616708.1 hypothetical protein [Gracilimonas sp.]